MAARRLLALLIGLAAALAAAGHGAAGPGAVPDVFALRVLAPEAVRGPVFRGWVQVYNPYDRRPLPGIVVRAELAIERWAGAEPGVEEVRRLEGSTDERGEWAFEVDAPDVAGFATFELTAWARYRGVEREVSAWAAREAEPRTVLSTDKRLYQPGQTLHVRGLWLDGVGRPRAGEPVELEVRDGRGRRAWRRELVTSRFGVAGAGWTIPASAPAGAYWIRTDAAETRVRISRYEMARFGLEVDADRPYYPAGEDAALTVDVVAVDGAPVAGAEVTLEPGGEPLPPVAGRTGADGRTVLAVDLAEAHRALAREDAGRDFHDLDVAVTATDPLSARSERATATLRVSRQPIHVYHSGYLPPIPEMPSRAWVATFYPDGEPAPCAVELRDCETGEVLARFATNAYGVGRLPSEARAIEALRRERELELLVEDAAGRRARAEVQAWHWEVREAPALAVEGRTLVAPGAPLEVTVVPSGPMERVRVELSGRGGTIVSRILPRIEGPTRAVFPAADLARAAPGGELWVTAYPQAPGFAEAWEDSPFAVLPVLVPGSRRLELEVNLDAGDHRPGGEARLSFTVDGTPAVLGVAIVDRGLELRQAGEGLPGPALLAGLGQGWSREVAGWTVERLLALDPDRIPDDLDLLAGYLLFEPYQPGLVEDVASALGRELLEHRAFFERQLAPVSAALDDVVPSRGSPTEQAPRDAAAFESLLATAGVDVAGLRDPWGSPYRLAVSAGGGQRRARLVSAGRDRAWDTVDDFSAWSRAWSYFQPLDAPVDRAVARFFRETGRFLRDPADLARELARDGVDWSEVRDPWGRAYRLLGRGAGAWYRLEVESLGDPAAGAPEVAWTSELAWGRLREEQLRRAVERWLEAGGTFPADAGEVRRALAAAGLDPTAWRDPEGRPVDFEVEQTAVYRDRVVYATPTSAPRLEPVTERFDEIRLLDGAGRVVGRLSRPRAGTLSGPRPDPARVLASGEGTLAGTVADDGGALLPGVTVRAERLGASRVAVTDETGTFRFALAAGAYRVTLELEGFRTTVYDFVRVIEGSATTLAVTLGVAAVAEEVVVTSQARRLATSPSGPRPPPAEKATPRLRRDFPETLLWLPELTTGEGGRAEVSVQLADALTTWQVAALASTADGRLAAARAEIPLTQPFSLEPDLPPLLTAGDEVHVPVYLHNRTPEGRTVELEVAAGSGAELLAAPPSPVSLEGEAARRLDLPVRFAAPGPAALRVTARGPEAGDAVERVAEVRPAGYRHAAVYSTLVAAGGDLVFDVAAAEGDARLDVDVDAGVADHLTSALEALGRRPTGCAEQQVSTAWLNLMLLRREREAGRGEGDVAARALRHLEATRDALVHHAGQAGGFAYWPGGRADLALTAYVLDFLRELASELEVDPELTAPALRWLLEQRQDGGDWAAPRGERAHPLAAARTTAWVARVLARWAGQPAAVGRVLGALEERLEHADDPYALAHAALAALAAGERRLAEGWLARLRALARDRDGAAAWHLESHTPFYGWGAGGRLETTAAAVAALLAADPADPLAERGLAFLLLEKDADGAWLSTQASLQTLRALTEALPASPASGGASPPEILVDGEPWRGERPLAPGRHRLSVAGGAADRRALVRATVRSVVPWGRLREIMADSAELRFEVDCGDAEVQIERPVECEVAVERPGFRGEGMLIAEIGLPPGADVDRASLDRAVERSGWALQSYEVRPDRVVAYLWPRAGGHRFRFTWRPRLALHAAAAPSVLYDYYNPAARVVLEPAVYRVRNGSR